jgi:hypothetical protein
LAFQGLVAPTTWLGDDDKSWIDVADQCLIGQRVTRCAALPEKYLYLKPAISVWWLFCLISLLSSATFIRLLHAIALHSGLCAGGRHEKHRRLLQTRKTGSPERHRLCMRV